MKRLSEAEAAAEYTQWFASKIDKIVRNPLSGRKPSPQEPLPRKLPLRRGHGSFPENRGLQVSVLKEIAAAVAGVYALLLVCDVAFGVGEGGFHCDYYTAIFYAPRPNHEFRFAGNTTPATRVADAFAQFTSGEA